MSQKPHRIDIYVDGCWLHPGKRNPEAVGGWGAVIIEKYKSYITSWRPSAPVERSILNNTMHSEITAALGALKAVIVRETYRSDDEILPDIILHSDNAYLLERIKKVAKDEPVEQELHALLQELPVTIKYAGHDKTGKGRKKNAAQEMAIAHEMAHVEAWAERLKKQGFISHSPNDRTI